MLLHSFYNFDYVIKLDITRVTNLLIKAKDKENENILQQRWLLHYQNSMTFDEFKNKLIENRERRIQQQVDDNLTEEEIMNDVEDILNSYRGGG